MAIPESGLLTLDEVVAVNLRKLRNQARLTRDQLATRIDKKTDESWTKWRILDLEAGRNRSRKVLWSDLVALARALKVTIFDLVLPPEDRFVSLGDPLMDALGMRLSRHLFGKWFFGISGESLTQERIDHMVERARETRSQRQNLWNDPRVIEEVAEYRTLFDEAFDSGDGNQAAKAVNDYFAAREIAVNRILEGKV